ncbi:hypothetical protein AB08_2997 [Escherichia coli 5-366-08_S1_C1]|nr:hypothetical protein AB67_2529 [Escherichia coli 5-366-08_S1_C3]KEL68814.1 hypothetical protein AB08_2997 [Escherichia coli 5-366-08_S1_C1]
MLQTKYDLDHKSPVLLCIRKCAFCWRSKRDDTDFKLLTITLTASFGG